ncbi:hypothetical protein PEX1_076970 [Penicillium expansum]|uniref:Uncharacterized protein n=1 Tax=Penicillium expansum TaxID=27334 RepID=A0A0A2JLS1_PENEN|nr:hypothetical protein PEX2_079740 [Penicillium expansum]KGO39783.1 hypothetical protein PEX1_076970 [Penicillium expansum]KGO42325.1 hypothetical protein PEXP_052770 [Penicillium expansum]KGO56367.1 hypothetical protein PEX2_079740 [Penicillium expansum]
MPVESQNIYDNPRVLHSVRKSPSISTRSAGRTRMAYSGRYDPQPQVLSHKTIRNPSIRISGPGPRVWLWLVRLLSP